jgi:pimeloyl-ACP methyl ester carboxylesterase
VAVHGEITSQTNEYLAKTLHNAVETETPLQRLKIRVFSSSDASPSEKSNDKTLLLIHGWMGDNTEWNEVGIDLAQRLPRDWSIVAIDLPGHGDTLTAEIQSVLKSLGLRKLDQGILNKVENFETSVDSLAQSIMRSLVVDYGINRIDAVAGYSLGGRVAMAMGRICQSNDVDTALKVMTDETRLILLVLIREIQKS